MTNTAIIILAIVAIVMLIGAGTIAILIIRSLWRHGAPLLKQYLAPKMEEFAKKHWPWYSPAPKPSAPTTPSSSATTPKKKGGFWHGVRVLFGWGFVLLFLFWFGTVVLQPHTIATPGTILQSLEFWKRQPLHPNFKERTFCTTYVVHDLRKAPPGREIDVPLSEGCYGDLWKFPIGVQTYEIQKSQVPGDYATLWCNGHKNPTRVVEYNEDGMGGEIVDGCKSITDQSNTFRAQGHGKLIFIPTVLN